MSALEGPALPLDLPLARDPEQIELDAILPPSEREERELTEADAKYLRWKWRAQRRG